MIRSLLGRAKEKINNRKREREKHTRIHALDLTRSCKFHIVQPRICKFSDKKPVSFVIVVTSRNPACFFLFLEKRIHCL